MKPTRWSCALLLAVTAGCAPSVRWNREDIRPTAVRGDRQLERVKFWSGDSVFLWHCVVISSDSITGYPEQDRGAMCQSCRRALPLSAVDSLRVGYAENATGNAGNAFGKDLLIIGVILAALLTP